MSDFKQTGKNHPTGGPRKFDEDVGVKETRKIRARSKTDATIWFGLGMFGLVGWAVAVPTFIGIALGVWLDNRFPGRISWTLTLLLLGIALGCWNAWYWVSRERKDIDHEERGSDRG